MQKGKAEKQRKKTNTENIRKTPDSRERLTIHLTDDQLTDKSLNCREHRECRLSRASRVSNECQPVQQVAHLLGTFRNQPSLVANRS